MPLLLQARILSRFQPPAASCDHLIATLLRKGHVIAQTQENYNIFARIIQRIYAGELRYGSFFPTILTGGHYGLSIRNQTDRGLSPVPHLPGIHPHTHGG